MLVRLFKHRHSRLLSHLYQHLLSHLLLLLLPCHFQVRWTLLALAHLHRVGGLLGVRQKINLQSSAPAKMHQLQSHFQLRLYSLMESRTAQRHLLQAMVLSCLKP